MRFRDYINAILNIGYKCILKNSEMAKIQDTKRTHFVKV